MVAGCFTLLLAAFPAAQPIIPPLPAPPVPAAVVPQDDTLLKGANLPTAGPGLLDFFRKRTNPGVDKAQVTELIKKLGDKAAATHDAAVADLISLGEPAVPALRQAANNYDDPEYAGRARQCIQNIEGAQGASVSAAAARAVAALKPDGAAEVLLKYLPYADNDKVEQEVEHALAVVGLRDGKPDPALLKALEDETPVRRAAAAAVLCQIGGDEQLKAVRPLLKDPKPTVRLRAALGLADAFSADGVPVLIDLLADLPAAERKRAEDYLTQLAGDWGVTTPPGNDVTARRLRRDAWAAWWKSIDSTVLLDEFKSRTMTDAERDQALALIQKLDDVSAEVREKASADLVAMGLKAAPLLRQASANPNPRIGPFALKCLELIEKEEPNPLPPSAARMLALRSPDGAVETLLAYLPFAENDTMAGQVRDLLGPLAQHDAKAPAVLVKALSDKIAVRRGAAAVALCRVGLGDNQAAVRKLLKDDDVDVRLRTALALIAARDREAVPALIDLLPDLPAERVWEGEEILVRLAGDKTPSVSLVGDAAARAKGRDAWKAWWADNNASIDLAKFDLAQQREYGFLLVIENQGLGKPTGRVIEYDAAGKERWKIENLQFPQDAQVLANNHVLLVDQNGQHVVERDQGGKVFWEKNVPAGFRAQRLRNGNTFVACRNLLVVYDAAGKEVLNKPMNTDTILDAQVLKDGQIAMVTYQGAYYRYDAAGKELKNARVPFNFNFGVGGGEVLANDHVLLSSPNTGKVYEYDGEGKVVFEGSVQQPQNFFRMSNGHTLVSCQNQTRIAELDATGKVVNEMKDLTYRPWRMSRR